MKDNGINLTQCGQSRPYADSIYAGTVTAETEEVARKKLQDMRGGHCPIYDKQDSENWHMAYFKKFEKSGENEWTFSIVETYTG